MNTKTCPRCKHEKEIEQFSRDGRVFKICNPCRDYSAAAYRKLYAEGRIKTYEDQREYRLSLFDKELPEGQKRCRTCLHVKPSGDFEAQRGESNHCIDCRRHRTDWARTNRAKWSKDKLAKVLSRAKELRDGRKRQVIQHYGGKCACCGISEIEFLTMDHIVRIGSKKRRENGDWGNRFYLNIIRRGFPADYRCLCWNCNWSHGCYGYCPHQKERELIP